MSKLALVSGLPRNNGHQRSRPLNAVNLAPDWQRPLVGTSFVMRRVHQLIARVAQTDSTVLIGGESGTGKELAAYSIHHASHRAGAPFIAINCATVPETILESELFGHERGAFTGAEAPKKGKFELADRGTLFLDEIGALAPSLQAKLLRVLEERRFERVGGLRPIRIDVRLIAATNADLEEAASTGAFRPDLYYRLKVISLTMPPLREHPEDIPPLVSRFVEESGRRNGRRVTGVSPEALSLLLSHTWPGNVRELRNAIEHACVTGTSDVILPHDLPEDILRRPRSHTRTPQVLDINLPHLARLIRNVGLEATLDGTPRVLGTSSIGRDAERMLGTATVTGPKHSTRTDGETVSHYCIIHKIGEGGMGVVYKAEDARLKRTVALKFLAQSALGSKEHKVRFLRGAKVAAALNHPNICTTHDFGEADGQPFIVMEYVEGENLRQKTKRSPLKLDEALHLAIEIARGLEAAHEKGIIHRDIKTSNIMIMPDGRPKIMDFGLARLRDESQITHSGTLLGTPAYMSPEQARGETVSERTDIWALGVVLYEMVAGRLPFRGEGGQAVLYSVLNEEPQPLTALRSGLPLELQQVVDKALTKDAAERYQHIAEMMADLKVVQKRAESAARSKGASTGWPNC